MRASSPEEHEPRAIQRHQRRTRHPRRLLHRHEHTRVRRANSTESAQWEPAAGVGTTERCDECGPAAMDLILLLRLDQRQRRHSVAERLAEGCVSGAAASANWTAADQWKAGAERREGGRRCEAIARSSSGGKHDKEGGASSDGDEAAAADESASMETSAKLCCFCSTYRYCR